MTDETNVDAVVADEVVEETAPVAEEVEATEEAPVEAPEAEETEAPEAEVVA